MKKRTFLPLALAAALLLSGAAWAEAGYDFDGKVVCIQPEYVTASIGGTVFSVPALPGQLVESGDALAELATTKIYAPADGTVTGVFCAPGDTVSDVTDRYDALLYIEPDSKYSLKASTDNSYNASANKYIHVGERLYLACTDGNHTGSGFVTQVDGADFTVEVTEGGFYIGETVSAYRNSSRSSKSRVGRGSIARIDNVAVKGETSENEKEKAKAGVAAVHVANGDAVHAGDLLIETLSGEYDARYCTGSTLRSDQSGILASLNVSPGNAVNKGDVIATLYPREKLQVEVDVNEADLSHLSVGTPVLISFTWNEDSDEAALYSGTVTRMLYTAVDSGKAEGEGSDAAAYAAYIDFEADAVIRLGMTATVRTASNEEEPEDEPEEEPEEELEEEPEAEQKEENEPIRRRSGRRDRQ